MRDPEIPITFVEALNEAQDQILERIPEAFIIGEGVPDPKGCFGTTKGLYEKYPDRVFDSPVSEAGVTGVCIGSAVAGLRPIHVHQRMDFSLYAMDQIVNNFAKWKSMFGLSRNLGMVIRMTVGRGWGAGNQHAQNLEVLFAHVPGLNVLVPHDPISAKGLLIQAVQSGEPTVFIEHKWLHNIKSKVSPEFFSLSEHCELISGNDVTLVSWGAAAQLAKQAAEQSGAELIILNRLGNELPTELVRSVLKTKRLLVISDAWKTCGYASEIVASVSVEFPMPCARITLPDYYVPSSSNLAADYYPTINTILGAIEGLTGKQQGMHALSHIPHDVDPVLGKVISAI